MPGNSMVLRTGMTMMMSSGSRVTCSFSTETFSLLSFMTPSSAFAEPEVEAAVHQPLAFQHVMPRRQFQAALEIPVRKFKAMNEPEPRFLGQRPGAAHFQPVAAQHDSERLRGNARQRDDDPQVLLGLVDIRRRLPAGTATGWFEEALLQALGALQHRDGLNPHPVFQPLAAHLPRPLVVCRGNWGRPAKMQLSNRGVEFGFHVQGRYAMTRWRPAPPRSSPYVTKQGFEKLQQELHALWKERREVVAGLAAAAAEGDRSESAEYIYRKKQLREMDRRIRYLQKRLPELKVVAEAPASRDKVYFGAWVTLEDERGE